MRRKHAGYNNRDTPPIFGSRLVLKREGWKLGNKRSHLPFINSHAFIYAAPKLWYCLRACCDAFLVDSPGGLDWFDSRAFIRKHHVFETFIRRDWCQLVCDSPYQPVALDKSVGLIMSLLLLRRSGGRCRLCSSRTRTVPTITTCVCPFVSMDRTW